VKLNIFWNSGFIWNKCT